MQKFRNILKNLETRKMAFYILFEIFQVNWIFVKNTVPITGGPHQCLQPRFETTKLVSSRVHFPGFNLANYFTWPSRVNQFSEGNSNENHSGNNMVQSMSLTNSFSGIGVRTSVSMVSSKSNSGGAEKSGNGGWPVRLL